MPQTVDRIDFACADVEDTSQWPKLSCGGGALLALTDGSLRLDADRAILFTDNGQLRSFDDNHKLVFDRTGNQLELHETGRIRFLTGAPTPTEKLCIGADGNVGIGTNAPSARLHVMGAIHAEGNLRITGDFSLDANLNVAGNARLRGDTQMEGNLQVSGFIDAPDVRQNGARIVSSQWTDITGGITFAGGKVGIGDVAPAESLAVAGRVKAGALTVGPWPANGAYVFFGTNALNQTQPGNYALLQDATGVDIGKTFLNSPRDIHFRIGNLDRMFLANNGNVGIGTTTPVTALEVVRDWSGEEGTLRLTGDKPTLRFTGGAIAGNQSWILHLGSHGPGNLAFYRRTGPSAWDHHLSLTPSGRVGIRTISPAVSLHVVGNRIRLTKTSDANHFVDLRADGSALDLESQGADLFINNHGLTNTRIRNLIQISSQSLKEDIATFAYEEAVDLLKNLRPVHFAYKDDETKQRRIGFIAEEVPALMATADRQGYRATDILAVLTTVIQEQQQCIAQLFEKVSVLEKAYGI